MKRMGAEAIMKVCKMGFSIGFERCKLMAQAFLPNNAEFLKANPSYESLKVMVDTTWWHS